MKILFLCVANSARSQMAEGLAKLILGSQVEVASAGSQPSGQVHPMAIKAMAELGLDLKSHHSKLVEQLPPHFLESLDFSITLCAEEICPVVLSNANRLHWAFPDPAAAPEAEQLASFQKIRDQIAEKLRDFKNNFSN